MTQANFDGPRIWKESDETLGELSAKQLLVEVWEFVGELDLPFVVFSLTYCISFVFVFYKNVLVSGFSLWSETQGILPRSRSMQHHARSSVSAFGRQVSSKVSVIMLNFSKFVLYLLAGLSFPIDCSKFPDRLVGVLLSLPTDTNMSVVGSYFSILSYFLLKDGEDELWNWHSCCMWIKQSLLSIPRWF